MMSARRVVADRFGGPEVLKVVDVAIAPPKAGQVVVRVEAAGVLYGDIMRRTDRYLTPTPLPYYPGTEIAGTVVSTGEDVSAVKAGDRVLSRVSSQGYSQYAIVDAVQAIILPDEIGFAEATALLAQGVTAHLLTHEIVPLKRKSVFIEAAAGGVGMQMVQMARAQGATFIVGSASSEEKRALARKNGVDLMVSSVDHGWSDQVLEATRGRGIDVAYESSGTGFADLLKCLTPFGTLVKFGRGVNESQSFDPAAIISGNQSLRGFYLPGYFGPNHLPLLAAVTRTLLNAVVGGELKIHVNHRFPLERVVLAHKEIEERKTTGKVVLEPWTSAAQ